MRIGRATTVALIAALSLVGFGCGSESEEDPLLQALVRSVKADDEYGARFTMRGTSTEDGETTKIRGYGQIEADEKRSRAVVTVAGGQRLELLTDEPFLFLNLDDLPFDRDDFGDEIPPGTRWLRVNQDSVADALGSGGLRRLESLSPTEAIKLIPKLDPKIELAGKEPVDGVQTTRYRMRVKLGKLFELLKESGGGDPDLPKSQLETEMGFVFWIDGTDLVRRVRIRLKLPGESLVLTVQISAYDRSLRVDIPRGSIVYDATKELQKRARAERGLRSD